MVAVILTEKPSAMKNFAKAFGGLRGTIDGTAYQLVASVGHIYEMVDPAKMVPASKTDEFASWKLEYLPWDETVMTFKRTTKPKTSSVNSNIAQAFAQASEIVIASDIDPTGEGDLLAWEIIDELGYANGRAPISRMEFTDEMPASLLKAFKNRRTVQSMQSEPNYRKALYRSKFDLLSMQWTRIATTVMRDKGVSGVVLRNGRLKSAMTQLVGDQQAAYHNYKKKPFFEHRFKDEVGVIYCDVDATRYDKAADVPQNFTDSEVIVDGSTMKKTAPPAMLDLASMSAELAAKGYKPKQVLDTYQKMYEAQIVSYPRTEDKQITSEQFKEMVGLTDQIARVVGVDVSLVQHRTPRKKHVKDSCAHGANRPGPNVPISLEQIRSEYGKLGGDIYNILARSFLRIMADDFEYEYFQAHLKQYPSYKGTLSVPKKMGWRVIFDDDDMDDVTGNSNAPQRPGTVAKPFIHEGANTRPPHPSVKWLMKQLEKHDVGTGATRTSTLSDVCSGKGAQLSEKRGKLTLTGVGEINYRLLPNTHIGNVEMTQHVYANMRAVADGSMTEAQALAEVKDLVVSDITTMKNNAANIPEDVTRALIQTSGGKERAQGMYQPTGQDIKFVRSFASHRFDDDEVETLLAGNSVTADDFVSKAGKKFAAKVTLAPKEFTTDDGKVVPYWGFDMEFVAQGHMGTFNKPGNEHHGKTLSIPKVFLKHEFSDAEVAALFNGEKVKIKNLVGKSNKPFTGIISLGNNEYKGTTRFGLCMEFDKGHEIVFDKPGHKHHGETVYVPYVWCKHEFSDIEVEALRTGGTIEIPDAFSKKSSKPFSCKGTLDEDKDGTFGFVPVFNKRK